MVARKLAGAALALALALALPAGASESLTWEQCVEEALRGNPDVAAAQLQVMKAQARVGASHSPLLPQLSAGASSRSLDSSREAHSASLSVTQNLFSGGRNRAGIAQARADLEATEAALAAVRAAIGSDLKGAFARLLFAQEQLALARRINDRRSGNVELVQLRYEGGREHRGSFLRIKASASQALFEVEQAGRAVRVAQRGLSRVLGRESPGGVSVTGEFGIVPVAEESPDVERLARQTPATLQAGAESRVAENGIDVAKSKFLPDIDATASAGFDSSRSFPPDESVWTAGLVMTFPFFPGGETIFDLREARSEHERTLAALKSVSEQAAADLESRFAALQDAVGQVGVRREFLSAADLRAEIARTQYTTGLLSFEDWDLIENDLIDNQKAMLASLRDAVLAEASWEQTLGKGALS